MHFDRVRVGMRYKNFKILTHEVENGRSPIQQLAIPHIYNLTLNPNEDTSYAYEDAHSWVLYEVYMPKTAELQQSLARESVPFGAPPGLQPIPTNLETPVLRTLGANCEGHAALTRPFRIESLFRHVHQWSNPALPGCLTPSRSPNRAHERAFVQVPRSADPEPSTQLRHPSVSTGSVGGWVW
jgi:hypothetical protein